MIKQVATLLGIIGALLMASNAGLNMLAYILLTASSSLFVWQFWKEKSLVMMNAVYILISLWGVISYA